MKNNNTNPYRSLCNFDEHDLDIVSLSLTNESILDWTKLNIKDEHIEEICQNHSLNIYEESDLALIERIKDESIAYLKDEFDFPTPKPIKNAGLPELLSIASNTQNRHRQFCACTLLKTMHIINHFDASEARQALNVTDQQLFQKAEAKIYNCISQMMADGLPIVEFMGGRKQRTSMLTKLLSKSDPLSAQLFDKMRFRVVTASKEDILPTINFLSKNLFPFNYILSSETYNTLFPFASYVNEHPHLKKIAENSNVLPNLIDNLNPVMDNLHSSPRYQVVHWVTDMPVRIENYKNAYTTDGINPIPRPIIYVRTEIQILDKKTHKINEQGDAAHQIYKARQKESVIERLKVKS